MQMRRKKTCCYGLEIIEVAIVFPILLLITLGVIHFAWLFLRAHQITSAARDGARLAALEGADLGQVEAHIVSWLAGLGIPVTADDVVFSEGSVAGHSCVTVQITVPGRNVALLDLSVFNVLTPDYLRGAVTMAKEGL